MKIESIRNITSLMTKRGLNILALKSENTKYSKFFSTMGGC